MTAAIKLTESEYGNSLVEKRFERIFGVEYAMNSPSLNHQMTLGRLGSQLLEKKSQHGFIPIIAPFDVYPLYDKGDDYTLVQPDIFLACDRSKLKDNRYNGAPKFIIEILSSNRSHDMVTKLNLYEKAGVGEYWIIDPEEKIITTLVLQDKGYITRAYTGEEEVQLAVIPGCSINFRKVFESLSTA